MRISGWISDVCSSDLFPLLSLPSVSSQLRFGARFVMNSIALDHHGAFFVQTENLDHRALAPELEDRLVQRAHRRDVPEVRTADIDHHLVEHRSEEHTSELQSLMRIPDSFFCLQHKNTQSSVQGTAMSGHLI